MFRSRIHFVALIAFQSIALAREGNTLGDELRIFKEETATQCSLVKEQLEDFRVRADPLTGYTLKDAMQSLCVRLPEKTEALRGTLTPEQLARPISQEEFLALFNPAVGDKCAAEQMHAMYGDECPRRFRRSGVSTAQYCSCMKQVVSGYSEAESAAIAAAATDYLPLAAEAENKGDPAPERPAALEGYYQADLACKQTGSKSKGS
jgi:hypothetical protein